MTRAALSTTNAGATIVGLRLRPEAAAWALGVPADELVDRRVALDELWSRAAVAEASEQLWRESTPAGKLAVVQRLARWRRDELGARDELVQGAVSLLAARPSNDEPVAKRLGLSERQLRRRFVRAVGFGPKVFQRIVRFQRLLTLANVSPQTRFGALSLEAGYADQAHMTREVCEFSGIVPSALLGRVESALTLSDLMRIDG
jgi:AraC-like DNA-binding protein